MATNMAAKKSSKKGMATKTKVAIGVGAVALAAATYYFFGPDGKKHRKDLKGWMIRMKGEVVEKMEQAKEMSESAYHTIVDTVAARYKNSGIAEADLKGFVANLKKQWKGFSASGVRKRGTAKKTAPQKKSAKSTRPAKSAAVGKAAKKR